MTAAIAVLVLTTATIITLTALGAIKAQPRMLAGGEGPQVEFIRTVFPTAEAVVDALSTPTDEWGGRSAAELMALRWNLLERLEEARGYQPSSADIENVGEDGAWMLADHRQHELEVELRELEEHLGLAAQK